MSPRPPYLVVREGKSFWIERDDPDKCSVTVQAYRDGCFSAAWCYDATGGLWPIAEATLNRRPSILHRFLPWLRIPVELDLGPREQVDVREVVSRLAVVLRSESDFCDHLSASAVEVLRCFERARTPEEVIRIAGEHGFPALPRSGLNVGKSR